MGARTAVGLLAALCLAARAAAQTSVVANEVAATPTGNLILNGYTTISVDGAGTASHVTSTDRGALYTLNPNGAVYSPFFSDATCAYVGFSSNFSTVDAFVTTKANFNAALTNGQLDYSKIQPLPAGSWKGVRSASAVLATNTTETYVFVVINTGAQAQDGSPNAPTQVGFRLANYDKSSTICPNSDNGGFPTSNESVRTNPALVPYFEENTVLKFKETRPFAVIDSASCVSFQLLAQKNVGVQYLDLLFFASAIGASNTWVTNKFPLPVPATGAACQQSVTASGPNSAPGAKSVAVNSSATTPAGTSVSVSASQWCQVNVDGLDPTQQYVIWGVNGQSSASGDSLEAFLRYSARGTGSCAGVAFPDPAAGGNYLGQASNVIFAINTGGALPPPTPTPSPTPSGPSTPGVKASPPPTPAATYASAGAGGSGGPGGAGGEDGGGAGGCGGGGGKGGDGANAGNGGSGGPGGAGGNKLGGGGGGCGGQGGGGGNGNDKGGKGGSGGSGGPGGAGGSGPGGGGGGAGGGGGGGGSALNNASGQAGSGGSGGPGGAGGNNNGGSGGSGGGGGSGGNALGAAPAGNGGSGGPGGAGGSGSSTASGGNGGAGGQAGNGGNSSDKVKGGDGGSGGPGGAGGSSGKGSGGGRGGEGGAGGAGGAGGNATGRKLLLSR